MFIFGLFLLASAGLANCQSVNLTSAGCIDAAGFQQCQDTATTTTAACLGHADADQSQLETIACGCSDYIANYNCYATHCWNRVNECEYQTYIVEYLVGCPDATLPVPYFPAPDNAPDSCSCNLGNVYLAINSSIEQGTTCSNKFSTTSITGNAGQAVQEIQGCECCEVSSALSSIYGICPTTDPSLIGLSSVSRLETALDTPFSSCGSYLTEFPCGSDLGFSPVAGGTFFSPDNLPASGTATLSNLAGTVTSPAAGAVFTYTNGGDNQVYTISAASVNNAGSGNGPATTAVSGGSPDSSTKVSSASSASSTATGSAANPSASKSWAQKLGLNSGIIICGIVIALLHTAV